MINAMFDIDKMLYFVAPEWWRPRLHRSRQQIPEAPQPNSGVFGLVSDAIVKKSLQKWYYGGAVPNPLDSSTVGWGGVNERERDNYFITDESEPANFGSSLGWLLQLDGDNMRNAFLNAPWVKAVIPIRPGQEEAAINWLKGVEGMNGITDDVIYHTNNADERSQRQPDRWAGDDRCPAQSRCEDPQEVRGRDQGRDLPKAAGCVRPSARRR